MAAGDIKGEEAIIIYAPNQNGITKGQLMHNEVADGHWELAVSGDVGPWGVAQATKLTGVTTPIVVYGRVEVTMSGTADIAIGQPVMQADATEANGGPSGTVAAATGTTTGLICGVAEEVGDTSGNNITIFLSRGGT